MSASVLIHFNAQFFKNEKWVEREEFGQTLSLLSNLALWQSLGQSSSTIFCWEKRVLEKKKKPLTFGRIPSIATFTLPQECEIWLPMGRGQSQAKDVSPETPLLGFFCSMTFPSFSYKFLQRIVSPSVNNFHKNLILLETFPRQLVPVDLLGMKNIKLFKGEFFTSRLTHCLSIQYHGKGFLSWLKYTDGLAFHIKCMPKFL